MIKILKIGEVSMEEVFARVNPTVNVESIVTEIIDNVRKKGIRPCLNTAKSLTKRYFPTFSSARRK